MTSVASTIRERRIASGLSEEAVARTIGLSVSAYMDVEHHEDELETLTPLSSVRALCALFGLDMFGLFGIPSTEAEALPSRHVSRHELVRESRRTLGLSRQDLADAIGYDVQEVVDLESEDDTLEMWRVADILELARILVVPPQLLLSIGEG